MIKSYNEMSVGVYSRLMDIINDPSIEDDVKNVEVVATLSGRTAEELMDIPYADYRLLATACDFLNHQPKIGKPKKSYRLGDFDCRVELQADRLTTAQYIDFKEFAATATEEMERFLSIFIIPKGKKYNDGYNMVRLHEAIRDHLSITDAQAITAFFFSQLRASTLNTLRSTEKMMKKIVPKTKEEKEKIRTMTKEMKTLIHSCASGGGITRLTFLLALPIRLGMLYTLGAPASS